MAAISAPGVLSQHIHRLDVRKDLFEVADLIELCFAETMDADGKMYLRQLRRAARDASWLGWIPGAPDVTGISLSGYVWVEDGHIKGNLSLIPLVKNFRRIYLIANVAVHPDYRRRGIARALTEAALHDIRERNGPEAWLQVRQENAIAYQLYQSLGFTERATRATWTAQPGKMATPDDTNSQIAITRRLADDWYLQQRWLETAYPADVSWNLPLRMVNFEPGIMNSIDRWMSGKRIHHWAARDRSGLAGVLTWEETAGASDHIWLALRPDLNEAVVQMLALKALQELPRRKTVSLNLPDGQAKDALGAAGFSLQQVLIWMQAF